MRELPYFKFVINDWNIGNIQLCNHEIKGIFVDIMVYYWRNDCNITIDDLEAFVKADKQCFSNARAMLTAKGIIAINNEGKVTIKFLDKQFKELVESHEKRVVAGTKGGKVKGIKQCLSNAKAKHKHIISISNNLNKEGGLGETEAIEETEIFEPPIGDSNFNPHFKEPLRVNVLFVAHRIGYDMTADEADKFIAHYQAQGWKANGGALLTDWRPLVTKWKIKSKEFRLKEKKADNQKETFKQDEYSKDGFK